LCFSPFRFYHHGNTFRGGGPLDLDFGQPLASGPLVNADSKVATGKRKNNWAEFSASQSSGGWFGVMDSRASFFGLPILSGTQEAQSSRCGNFTTSELPVSGPPLYRRTARGGWQAQKCFFVGVLRKVYY